MKQNYHAVKANYRNLFRHHFWWTIKFDARKKIFRGISREEFEAAKAKFYERNKNRTRHIVDNNKRATAIQDFIDVKEIINSTPADFEYTGDHDEDYVAYHRPTSNGIGYVFISPAERGNNCYISNLKIVRFLMRKYYEKLYEKINQK